MKDLSILICTTAARRDFLERLKARLIPQLSDGIEVLINQHETDTVGKKRNDLIAAAGGGYLSFVDDDDLVSEDYVARILGAIESGPDVVGMEGIITADGGNPQRFVHSLRYDHWFEADRVFYRNPNHLNPVRSELARQVVMPEVSFAEDRAYSAALLPLLKTEVYLDGPIYFYEYRTVR